MIKKPELLAPAGDLERLKYAIHYGADAVYIGGPILGLRANAINFSFEDIKEGVEFAHRYHKKVYVTVNIVLHNKEIDFVIEYLKKLEECQIDAIIVSDLTIIEFAKKYTNLEIHLSTQASIMNVEACKFYKQLGVTRIVLARELSKEEIQKIIEEVDIEIECFIHGAMCSSISGRCVLSNFLTNRDSNRGGCSQICRWDFKLLDENKRQIEGEKDFTLCAKDLSLLAYIKDMMDIGIASFKIEGRMRSIYYIATIVGVYRKVIDGYWDNPKYQYNPAYEKILRNCANRDAVGQFFNHKNDVSCQYYNGREEISNQDFLGIVLAYNPITQLATIEQRNYFKEQDQVEIFGPNTEVVPLKLKEIYDENQNRLKVVCHPREIVQIKIESKVEPYDLIRIKKFWVDKQKKS